ncbi:MAG: DUF1559 domain-containing protein [Pirellulales bacterium]|nr:DUF1559 domain-containing protein [Pirellulales bacterium]
MGRRTTRGGDPLRSAFTWIEVLVVVVIAGVLAMLYFSFMLGSRESTRRMTCINNLKQIGLAIHNYTQANKAFPPGTICNTEPISSGTQYDVWTEAGKKEVGAHGTSFLLRVMPYLEGDSIARKWSKGILPGTTENCWSPAGNAGTPGNPCEAALDVVYFYCPCRRDGLRPEDEQMMLEPWWPGGGTDYGGCAGRHAAFSLETGYNLCDASMVFDPHYYPEPLTAETDTAEKRWGIFGRVNVSTTFKEIRDGTSNTIMTGELQRITDFTPGSKDGWSVGGPATLFTTGAMFRYYGGKLECTADPKLGKLMNNHFFGSPGSVHAGVAHFGLADGAVRFLLDEMDPRVFSLLGSMADGVEVLPP